MTGTASLNTSKARPDSTSPTTSKTENQGVKLSADQQSPDDMNMNGGSAASTTAPNWKGPQQDGGRSSDNNDPFSNGSKGKGHASKLSADAATFKPSGSKPSSSKPSPIDFLNFGSTEDSADHDDHPVIVSSENVSPENSLNVVIASKADKGKSKAVQEPIGTRGAYTSPSRVRVYFTTEVGPDVVVPGGHYIKIDNVNSRECAHLLQALDEHFGWNAKTRGVNTTFPNASRLMAIFACFDDIRDARGAFDDIQMVNPSWSATYISQTEYASIKKGGANGSPNETSYHDGQVYFKGHFNGTDDLAPDGLPDQVLAKAKSYGEVLVFQEIEAEAGCTIFRVEFFKIAVSKQVAQQITKASPITMGQWLIYVEELPDYSVQVVPRAVAAIRGAVTPQRGTDEGIVEAFSSPTGRTTWHVDEDGKTIVNPPSKRIPKCTSVPLGVSMTPQHRFSAPDPHTPLNNMGNYAMVPRSGTWSGPMQAFGPSPPSQGRLSTNRPGMPNFIDRERILKGHDVRTTIMLRNLPNQMRVQRLKEILDETHKGLYDFSYLRVDYSSNNNIGYGFVNFTDPLQIVAFHDRWSGRRWMPETRRGRNGDLRIAELSYASVQGIDCIIEKFRNSSVLDEYKDFRPKLWYTFQTAPDPSMVGMEHAFPESNNIAKLARSRANAPNLGLYGGNSGRKRNNNGSGHRSQFDRGTMAQINEDACFNQSPLVPNGFTYGYGGPNYMVAGSPMPGAPPPHFVPPPAFAPVGFNGFTGFNNFNNPLLNGVPTVASQAFGPVHFTDPFNGGYAQPPVVPMPPQAGPSGPHPVNHPQHNTVVRPRTREEAIRKNAENAANDRYEDNMAMLRGEPVPGPSTGHQGLPRVLEVNENGENDAVNYSGANIHDGQNVNGNGHAFNPYY